VSLYLHAEIPRDQVRQIWQLLSPQEASIIIGDLNSRGKWLPSSTNASNSHGSVLDAFLDSEQLVLVEPQDENEGPFYTYFEKGNPPYAARLDAAVTNLKIAADCDYAKVVLPSPHCAIRSYFDLFFWHLTPTPTKTQKIRD
jgi:hypothetical protein